MFWSIRRSRAQPQRTRKCPLLAPASSRKAGACRWHLRHTSILRTAGLCNLIRLRGIFRLENLYRGGMSRVSVACMRRFGSPPLHSAVVGYA